jgi:hypothetical protein
MVVAVAALCVAIGGSASAAILVTSKSIKNGTVRGKDVHNRTLGTKKLTKKAIASLKGKNGTNGRPGVDATRLFVQVNSGTNPPTATRGSGVVKIDGPTETGFVGNFEVTFNRDVSRCAPLASRSSPDGNFPGIGSATANHSSANVIGVQTSNGSGAAATADFSLAVFC